MTHAFFQSKEGSRRYWHFGKELLFIISDSLCMQESRASGSEKNTRARGIIVRENRKKAPEAKNAAAQTKRPWKGRRERREKSGQSNIKGKKGIRLSKSSWGRLRRRWKEFFPLSKLLRVHVPELCLILWVWTASFFFSFLPFFESERWCAAVERAFHS